MNILVTGGAGFIGSNFIKYILSKYNYKVINLDLLTYAGSLKNLENLHMYKNYYFVKGDICDKKLISSIFEQYKINIVINFAAESHVDRSIEDPTTFLRTNIKGTQVLLEIAKENWKINKNSRFCTRYIKDTKFVQISTDEVYGSLGKEGYFTEASPLLPNSPYASSKASADLLVRAYYTTYGLPINITRCTNNYGPNQFPEKLIPLTIVNGLNEKQIPLYGNGKQVRDWLHVEDHCTAIDKVIHSGAVGEIYNIGGNNERENIEVVEMILSKLDKNKSQIRFVKDRLGHDKRYAINNTKITTELGWSPSYKFEEGIEKTIQWYVKNKEWINDILTGGYKNYYELMYTQR